jgi:LysR family transcriptional regulator, regulator of abg operon
MSPAGEKGSVMKLSQIRDVIAIAQQRSLRGAAQHLGLAQPALTRSVRELEHELGVSLFERKPHGMTLTPMGDIFIRRARTVQAEIQRSREEIDQLRGSMTGQVSFGLSMASALSILPGVLKKFPTRFPGVRLKITEGFFPELRHGILEGELDFYVGPILEMPQSRQLAIEEMMKNELIVVGRKGHPLRHARSLVEVAGARWVGTAISANGISEPQHAFKMQGLAPPEIEIETQSAIGTIIAAATGDFLAILPRSCLRYPGFDELLDRIEVGRLAAPPICLVRRATLPLTPAAEFLSDMIRRAATAEIAAAKPGRAIAALGAAGISPQRSHLQAAGGSM